MKKFIVTIAGLLSMFSSFGQSKSDTGLVAYARNNGYVQITDTLHLPAVVKSYYSDLIYYFAAGHGNLKEMFVRLEYLRNSPTELEIPLEDISSIAYQKKMDERNAILQTKPDTVMIKGKKTVMHKMELGMFGNISGHDGVVRINKDTREVKFLMSQ